MAESRPAVVAAAAVEAAAVIAAAPSTCAGTLANAPLKLPTGVRAADTITTSSMAVPPFFRTLPA